jgi:hypothetical protein
MATQRAQAHPGREYTFRVRGAHRPTVREFPSLDVSQDGEETTLTGGLSDKWALYAVLHQLEALGLHLIELRSAPPDVTRQPMTSGRRA